MSAYPIVAQSSLPEAAKQGPLGLLGRRREIDQLPQAEAHQVLVYRVDGEYVTDNGRRGLDHDQVVRANHVSVVDMSRDIPVMVELAIPSAEASEFTVQVTFLCTVTDARTVVREGQQDAKVPLLAYLRGHHRIFELGLDHRMVDINRVRRDVRAQVQAYTQLKPPIVHGLSITLAGVEVLTPDELIDFHKTLRGQQREATIASGQQRFGHDLEVAKTQYDQALQQLRSVYDQESEKQRLTFEQGLAEQRRVFAQAELAQVRESIGEDPLMAAMYANVRGELSVVELQRELQAAQDRQRAELAARDALAREDNQRREQAEREERLHALSVRLDVLKEVAAHGHIDEINVDVERLIGSLTAGTEASASGASAALGESPDGSQGQAALESTGADSDDTQSGKPNGD